MYVTYTRKGMLHHERNNLNKKRIVTRLYAEGKTTRQIAKLVDVSPMTISRWINEYLKEGNGYQKK